MSGDYVFFLDSDDWLSIDAIEKFVRSAKVGEPDIVVGQGLAFSDDDTKNTRIVTESVNLWLALPKEVEVRAGNLLMMVSKIPCVAWGKLFREALQKPLFPSRIEQNRSVRFFFTTSKNGVFFAIKIV